MSGPKKRKVYSSFSRMTSPTLTGRSPRFTNLICARICAQDAVGRVETRETQRTKHERPPSVRQGQRGNQRPRETAETDVVGLITQRRLATPRCAVRSAAHYEGHAHEPRTL